MDREWAGAKLGLLNVKDAKVHTDTGWQLVWANAVPEVPSS